jgi:hypothetical protein
VGFSDEVFFGEISEQYAQRAVRLLGYSAASSAPFRASEGGVNDGAVSRPIECLGGNRVCIEGVIFEQVADQVEQSSLRWRGYRHIDLQIPGLGFLGLEVVSLSL